MAAKLFLDANILIDFALHRNDFEDANLIMDLVVNRGFKGHITSSVLHIASHWIAKEQGSDKAKKFFLTLLDDIKVIDISHEIAIIALSSTFNDIEDALQYCTAIHHKINYFISRDKLLQRSALPILPVYSPKEFLREFY